MAANKFATFLHKKTNKLTLILIYAVLEWTLIVLLLLNSLFSYLIIKFAVYFGLKSPCLWCSRVDHMFEQEKNKNSHIDLLCEKHSNEISKLGYCSNHKKLAESDDMCEKCSFSTNLVEANENSEVDLKCSCCTVSLDKINYSSLDFLGYTENSNLFEKEGANNDPIEERDMIDFSIDRFEVEDGIEKDDENQILYEGILLKENAEELSYSVSGEEGETTHSMIKDPSFADNLSEVCPKKELPIIDIEPQHIEFFVGHGGYRLIPVELIDSPIQENQSKDRALEEKDSQNCDIFGENFDFEIKVDEAKFGASDTMQLEENENSLIFHPNYECDFESFYNGHEEEKGKEKVCSVRTVKEEVIQIQNIGSETDVSIGTEIPDLDLTDETQNQETHPTDTYIDDDPSASFADFQQDDINGVRQVEEEASKLNDISVDVIKVLSGSELSDIEEDKIPDTPTSSDSLQYLLKKLLMLEKRELGKDESLDGSVTSELENGDGVLTVDSLKSVLKSERKALHTLYTELEEERSASAIAANQTMAMITRLQEEKSAMQMEALQYQRMMEEQSEYDQEALQLLNELMVKREKEKQELERELEVYRKKVLEYEGKEKMRCSREVRGESVKSESFYGSSSNNEDIDGLSMDLNREAKEEELLGHENGNHNTPVDEVLDLENFEEERISILEQLKALEEKLFTMSDEEEHFEDIKPIEHFYEENGKHLNGVLGFGYNEENGFIGKTNEKIHPEGRIKGIKGKRLLPLFDEMSDENIEKIENGHVKGHHAYVLHSSNSENGDSESKRVCIEEEVDQLYERLQALEEDREFLKHCIGSLKKGDKGMDLLQEILQHLRDLRNAELRARNLGDTNLV